MTSKRGLTCATWNIHRGRGPDGRVDPTRVTEAIARHFGAGTLDVLALQEADAERPPHAGLVNVARLERVTGLVHAQDAPHQRWGAGSAGFLGTVVFLHPRLRPLHTELIDLPGHCPRGAVSIEAATGGRSLRIVSAHLSLSQPLRLVQMRILGQYLRRRPDMQTILLGDLNEWRPWGGLMFSPRVTGTTLRGPARRTFPSTRPLLPLDRVLTDPPGRVIRAEALRERAFARASDHLPLVAVVETP
jgi:endonuclease/exonuclease/phosphatase family metal-dependent hydrolase